MHERTHMTGLLWWLVIFGITWNALFGVADFILIELQQPAYLNLKAWLLNSPPRDLTMYYEGWPQWARAGWVMNAWGGLAGSILVALKDRHAVWMFATSLIGMAIVTYFLNWAPTPRTAGDPWAGFVDTLRIGTGLLSGLHAIAIMVAFRWIGRTAPAP